jgi:hypothetical protein
MAGAMVSATVLAREPFYATCALAGAAFGVLALIGYRVELGKDRKNIFRKTLFTFPYYFLSMHLALLLGLLKCLRGTQTVIWNPTVREAVAADSEEQEENPKGVHA